MAPLAVNVLDEPEHIVPAVADTATVGVGSTVTVIVFCSLHPAALEPVTVYVVVATGVTDIELVIAPVLHV